MILYLRYTDNSFLLHCADFPEATGSIGNRAFCYDPVPSALPVLCEAVCAFPVLCGACVCVYCVVQSGSAPSAATRCVALALCCVLRCVVSSYVV
jgi:hypothetical protein